VVLIRRGGQRRRGSEYRGTHLENPCMAQGGKTLERHGNHREHSKEKTTGVMSIRGLGFEKGTSVLL